MHTMQPLAEVSARPGFRKAAANLGWLLGERAVRFVLGLLVGILVVRYLGPVKFGGLSYCMALISLLGFVPGLGLDATLKRDVLRFPERTGELMVSSLLLRLAAGGIAYVGVLIAAKLEIGLSGDESRLVAVLGLLLFQPALWVTDTWMQAQLQAKRAVLVQLSALAAASGMRLWLVYANASVLAFAWVVVIEMMLGGFGLYCAAHGGGLRISFALARIRTMRLLLMESWPLMFASLAIVVYMKVDEVMLRHMVGESAVGIYSAASRLSEIWYFIPTALASSLLPALLRARESDLTSYRWRLQQYYDLSASAAYMLSLPIALLAPWLVQIAFGEAFAAAAPILAVHIWSSVFVFLGVARGQWLVNEGMQKFYLVATCAGAVANVLLNLVFIPLWDGLGAAYATVVSYALAAWLASYLHPAVRVTAAMQTRALLIPIVGWRYLRRS